MPSAPRIALVCDWLTTPGGAEKVLLELHHMHPDAPIYTSQYRPKKIPWFKDAHVKTGWMQFFPAGLRRFLGVFRQFYFSHLDLTDYDLVISVTGAEAKSVKAKRHLCYCHVPTQYYWQLYDKYIKDPGFGILDPFVRLCFKLLVKPLRKADFRVAKRPDQFVTISNYSAQQIQKYYHRDSVVIHPSVEIEKFMPKSGQKSEKIKKFSTDFSTGQPYYIIFCRQVPWKRIDLAIKACLALKKRLLVIGDGAEHQALQRLAGDSELITFLPWLETRELAYYAQHASAYLFPSLEPFGIAAVEALSAGCPVIAYAEGGSLDFIIPGENGLLFPKQTAKSLENALIKFESESFNRQKISKSVEKFSPQHFRSAIAQLVKTMLEQ